MTNNFEVGDTIWYLDLHSEDAPKIREDIVESVIGWDICKIKNDRSKNIIGFKTKQDLLDSLEPCYHNFRIDQIVYIIDDINDKYSIRIDQAEVIAIRTNLIHISFSGLATCWKNYSEVFEKPYDAFKFAMSKRKW